MKFLLLVLAIVACLTTGETLKCFNCKNPPYSACGPSFDQSGTGVAVVECAPQSKCYTSKDKIGDVEYIARGCMVTLGVNSSDYNRKDDSPGHTHSIPNIIFCDTDLCNSASSINIALSTLMSVIVLWIFTKL